MPVLRGSVTFSRFVATPTAKPPKDLREWVSEGLKLRAFMPLDRKTGEERACGFVELEDHDAVEFPPAHLFRGEWALLAWRVDLIKVSGAALREELERWSVAFEREQGRPAKRFERSEKREALKQQLRAKAEPKTRILDISWKLDDGQIQIWSASKKAVEEVVEAMEKSFGLQLTAQVPAALARAMGYQDEDLKPTPELAWPGLEEAGDEQA